MYTGEGGNCKSPEEIKKEKADKKAKVSFQKAHSKRKKKGKKTHR